MKKFILISMVLFCLIAIFMFSSENALDSMNTSVKVSNVINYDNVNLVRKGGHFIEFFVLEILLLCAISSFKKIDFRWFIISVLFCLFYASTDEFHQLFVSGRSGSVFDVMIDFVGSTIGGILFVFFDYIYYEVFAK